MTWQRAGRWVEPVLWALLVAFLVGAPAAGLFSRYALSVLWYIGFFVTLASAWNILGGFAGQVSFGYSAFLGIGAYTTGLLWARAGWSPYLTIPVGVLVAMLFSVLIGLPTFRLRGPFFAIATIGIGEALRVLMLGMEWTGGSSGLRMPSGGYDPLLYYYLALGLAMVTVASAYAIRFARFGLALRSIRQDEDAAEALGINTTWYKLVAHALSAGLVAIAGSLYTMQISYINPGAVFSFQMGLALVLMPTMGGIGTVVGPVLGGVMYGYVEKQLLGNSALRDWALFIYGGLLILIMLFEPGGLLGAWRRVVGWVNRRPKRVHPTAAGPGEGVA